MIRAAVVLLLLGAAIDAAEPPPKLMLWAWERATDLRFVKSPDIGVAYHFASLRLAADGRVEADPRRDPLLLPPGIYTMPVIRIDAQEKAPLSAAQRAAAVEMIGEALRITRTQAIQIDFDAPKSARPFYRALLDDVRKLLGPKGYLSITALVSWCNADSWMAGLPVDEMVPMRFRIGYPAPKVPGEFPFAGCRGSVGVDLSVRDFHAASGQRLYAFPNYEQWNEQLVERFRAR